MNILMPMAGEGSRTKVRSDLPKPLIPILGLPMFHWAVSSAKIDSNKIFVIQKDHIGLEAAVSSIYPKSSIVVQEGRVRGAALSCLLAKDLIMDDPLLVMDCDMRVNLDYSKIISDSPEIGVVTFTSQSPAYSYVGKDGKVVEKKVVSSKAVAGSFYWRSGSDFVKYAIRAVDRGIAINNEFYISSVINEAVTDGLSVTTYSATIAYDLSTDQGTKDFINDFYR